MTEIKQFGVFKISIEQKKGVPPIISFIAIPNFGFSNEPMLIDSEDAESAAKKVAEFLKPIGTATHSKRGNPDTVMHDFPDYFVGEVREFGDDSSTKFRIHQFVPVPRI
jgi:hypothetical protein